MRKKIPTQRASRMAVSLSSMDGKGDASKSLTVADGKKRRPTTAGMVIRISNAKAFWMLEGIVKEGCKISVLRTSGHDIETQPTAGA